MIHDFRIAAVLLFPGVVDIVEIAPECFQHRMLAGKPPLFGFGSFPQQIERAADSVAELRRRAEQQRQRPDPAGNLGVAFQHAVVFDRSLRVAAGELVPGGFIIRLVGFPEFRFPRQHGVQITAEFGCGELLELLRQQPRFRREMFFCAAAGNKTAQQRAVFGADDFVVLAHQQTAAENILPQFKPIRESRNRARRRSEVVKLFQAVEIETFGFPGIAHHAVRFQQHDRQIRVLRHQPEKTDVRILVRVEPLLILDYAGHFPQQPEQRRFAGAAFAGELHETPRGLPFAQLLCEQGSRPPAEQHEAVRSEHLDKIGEEVFRQLADPFAFNQVERLVSGFQAGSVKVEIAVVIDLLIFAVTVCKFRKSVNLRFMLIAGIRDHCHLPLAGFGPPGPQQFQVGIVSCERIIDRCFQKLIVECVGGPECIPLQFHQARRPAGIRKSDVENRAAAAGFALVLRVDRPRVAFADLDQLRTVAERG